VQVPLVWTVVEQAVVFTVVTTLDPTTDVDPRLIIAMKKT